MGKVRLAVAILALAAVSSVSAVRGDDEVGRTSGTGGRTSDTPAVMSATAGKAALRPMTRSPEHQLMMAYHRNVVLFGRALERVARQGETVPRDFARTAVSEMRRSTQEIEKYRAGAMAGMPEERRARMQKMMDEHLVSVKTQLRQLEEVAQRDTVPSRDVLTHLQPILHGAGMSPGMMHGGMMHGKGMRGKGMYGCGGCGSCGDCQGCQGCQGGESMMPQHRQMMQQMTQRLKAQDAELIDRVDRMKRAPKDKKIDQLAEIVSLIVQQRAAVTSQMEKMQRQSLKESSTSSQGAAATTVTPATPPVMGSAGGYCDEEEDAACEDADDMDDAGE